MNNYISIDEISASLMASTYLIILASIATIINISNSIVSMIFYNIIFLFIFYNAIFIYILKKFQLSKVIGAVQIVVMVSSTLLFLTTSYSVSNIWFLVLSILSCLYFISSIIRFYVSLINIYKYSYIYINKNKFKPRPVLLLAVLFLYFFIAGQILFNSGINSFIYHYKLMPILYFLNTLVYIAYIYLFYNIIYKYKSAYVVLSLSSNRKIYISSLAKQYTTDGYEWFKNQVEPYVYYAHYNEENNIITFDDEDDIIKSNENNEALECSLDKSIAVIKSLLENENSHEIAGILKSIIDKLNKINNMHQEKHQFNKYIQHINERYIPYVKSLVQAYYNNMQLDLDLTKTMQEKIILSLEKINDTFEKSVQEMYNKNMLELESYMQAMDIMLNYKSIS